MRPHPLAPPAPPYNVTRLDPSLGMGMGTREMYYISFNHKRGDRAQLRKSHTRMHARPDLCVLFAHVLMFLRSQVRDQTDRHVRSCGSDKSDLGMPQKSCPGTNTEGERVMPRMHREFRVSREGPCPVASYLNESMQSKVQKWYKRLLGIPSKF